MKTHTVKHVAIVAGMHVSCFGNIGKVIRVRPNGAAAVHFTGRTTDGRFGSLKGGMTAHVSNLQPLTIAQTEPLPPHEPILESLTLDT